MDTQKTRKSTRHYTPYGYSRPHLATTRVLFNGELFDTTLHGYLLGMGARHYSTTLMRFGSPDRLSPFDRGGINTYSYCLGDPINFRDLSGHIREGTRPMRRELVNLGKAYDYEIISRRPVKLPTSNIEDSPLRKLLAHQHIAQKITEHLNFRERGILAELSPEFSAHNTFKIENSMKNQKITLPPRDSTDAVIRINMNTNKITKEDAIAMLERKASATRAGYVYDAERVALSVSRIRSRAINNITEPDTTLLWK